MNDTNERIQTWSFLGLAVALSYAAAFVFAPAGEAQSTEHSAPAAIVHFDYDADGVIDATDRVAIEDSSTASAPVALR